MNKLKQNRDKLEEQITALVTKFHIDNELHDSEQVEIYMSYIYLMNEDTGVEVIQEIKADVKIII